jgi:AcrR family transcriptional regulator
VPLTSRQAEGVRSRELLLKSAIEYMARSGRAVNFDQIASAVGLTKGALYHHFGSVDGLVEAVFKEAVRLHAERVISASEAGSGRARLQGLIDASAMLYGSDTPFYRLLLRLHVEAGTTRPFLAPVARRVQRRQREYMSQLVRDGQEDGSIRIDVDPEAVGETVNAVMQGLLVQQIEEASDQRQAAERFGDLLEVVL